MAGLGVAVAFNFFVTLAAYPAVTADVTPYSFTRGNGPQLWVGIYCFLIFNSGDWSGRVLAGWAARGWTARISLASRSPEATY